MRYTDPIADYLTRIRNASIAGLAYTTIPASRIKIDLTKILEDEGFIRGFRLIRDGKQGKIKIALRYADNGEAIIKGLDRVSKPGCRVYKAVRDLPKVKNGLGIAILSTSVGVLTDEIARTKNIGGELLAFVW